MSLFSEWNKEYMGRETIENDNGFISYQINGDICYIADIFVKNGQRSYGRGSNFMSEVEQAARSRKCKKLITGIVSNVPEATGRILFAIANGYRVQSSVENYIWLEKEIF